MRKSTNQKAWWLVAPVLLLVAFNAFIPADDRGQLLDAGNLR